jgi:hypothetical protein
LLGSLKQWLEETLVKLSKKSDTAMAVRYALGRWEALMRFCDDGNLEIDNNAAERSLRAVALGRKNYLFAGSDRGGESAAAIYSLIGTAKLNGIDPENYLGTFCPASPIIPLTVSKAYSLGILLNNYVQPLNQNDAGEEIRSEKGCF